MEPAIRVENLSKKYLIRHQAERAAPYDTFRDALGRLFKPGRRSSREEFWALSDLSFEVQPGEVLGIIGRNGAGKSTLLKLLARITEPTKGRIELNGRTASLLEVGTGFHPELTGRENIYLNGAILGMSRAEIRKRFDEIVDFAGVEKFIDTPVKRYSSGMSVRLAFAVAAHLEPEILIVDEVLAVGDFEFQKKCLGKIEELSSGHGRTILLVSHVLGNVARLCSHALLLNSGTLVAEGKAVEIIAEYETSGSDEEQAGHTIQDTGDLVPGECRVVGPQSSDVAVAGSPLTISFRYQCQNERMLGQQVSVSFVLYQNGHRVTNLWTEYHRGQKLFVSAQGEWCCTITRWPFRQGEFEVELYVSLDDDPILHVMKVKTFNSVDGPFYGEGRLTHPEQGIVFVDHDWS